MNFGQPDNLPQSPLQSPLLAFQASAPATNPLERLQSWKDRGYTDIILFGRFQPFHKGHMNLLETLKASGLNVNLVINDKTDGIEGERNPFNFEQRKHMAQLALPWLKPESIQSANVYLGGGGDVGPAVKRLTGIFNGVAPDDKLVFAYYEKGEDRKSYLVDGETIDGAHYVELVGQPRGKFPIQRIDEEMIRAVTGTHYDIDAKMFRKAVMNVKAINEVHTRQQGQFVSSSKAPYESTSGLGGDEIAYELLHPKVAAYIKEELHIAIENNRPVGLNPSRGLPDPNASQDANGQHLGL